MEANEKYPSKDNSHFPQNVKELEARLATHNVEINLPYDAGATLSKEADGSYRFEWTRTFYNEEQSHPSQNVPSCEALLLLNILFSRQYTCRS